MPAVPAHSLPVNLSDAQHCWDIRQRLVQLLWQRGLRSLRKLEIEVAGGTVTLRGSVRSFYERQLCLVCAQRVPGVMRLVDQLQVELRTTATNEIAVPA